MTAPLTMRATCPKHGPQSFTKRDAMALFWTCARHGDNPDECWYLIDSRAWGAPDGGDVILWTEWYDGVRARASRAEATS